MSQTLDPVNPDRFSTLRRMVEGGEHRLVALPPPSEFFGIDRSVTVPDTGSIRIVLEGSSEPQNVRLLCAGEPQWELRAEPTDSFGSVEIRGVPPGEWIVCVSAGKLIPVVEAPVRVEAAARTDVTVDFARYYAPPAAIRVVVGENATMTGYVQIIREDGERLRSQELVEGKLQLPALPREPLRLEITVDGVRFSGAYEPGRSPYVLERVN